MNRFIAGLLLRQPIVLLLREGNCVEAFAVPLDLGVVRCLHLSLKAALPLFYGILLSRSNFYER